MRRFAIERPLMLRRRRRRFVVLDEAAHYPHPGMYRKFNGCGCRGSHCSMCHPDRKYAGKTIQEKRHE